MNENQALDDVQRRVRDEQQRLRFVLSAEKWRAVRLLPNALACPMCGAALCDPDSIDVHIAWHVRNLA